MLRPLVHDDRYSEHIIFIIWREKKKREIKCNDKGSVSQLISKPQPEDKKAKLHQ